MFSSLNCDLLEITYGLNQGCTTMQHWLAKCT